MEIVGPLKTFLANAKFREQKKQQLNNSRNAVNNTNVDE